MKTSTISRLFARAVNSLLLNLHQFLPILMFFFVSAQLTAQPVPDANTMTEKGANTTSISIPSFSVPANDDRLLVAYALTSVNATPPAITFGSSSMTQGPTKTEGGLVVTMYYLVLGSSASPTTNAVTATGNNLYYLAATSFHNVDQSDPTDGETSTSISGTTTLSTLTVNSSPTGLVCDAFGYYTNSGATDITEGMGQTLLFKRADSSPLLFRFGSSTKAGASPSVAMNWTVVGTPPAGLGSHVGMNLRGLPTCPATGTVWYVDAAAAPGGTGTSWACAFQNVQDAINAASSSHEIWVKAGTYLPTKDPSGNASPTDPRDKVFYLKNGVALYGGFAGTETMRSQRLPATNITTLSGDIGTPGDNTDNCYHVVLSVSDGNTTVLDGFTVTGAYTNGSGNISVESINISRANGGGMYNRSSSASISNCTFSGNTIPSGTGLGAGIYNSFGGPALNNCLFSGNSTTDRGGGVYNTGVTGAAFDNCTFINNSSQYGGGAFNTSSTITFTACTFQNNSASNSGGAMRSESSTSIAVTDCLFSGNTAVSSNGGGFYIGTSSTSAILTNCLLFGNSTGGSGGGIYNSGTPTVTLTNCTVTGNKAAGNGGGMMFLASNPTLTNCVIWNNRASGVTGSASASLFLSTSVPIITYSLIQNHNPSGTGNLDGITNAANPNYPEFVTPLDPATAPSTEGDFHITACSPVLNLGTNVGAPTNDLFGNARPFATTVDLGVHELQSASLVPTTANAGADQSIGVNSATMAANTPIVGTGVWSLVNGSGTITEPGNPNTTITNLGSGTNTFRWTISSPPCTASTDDIEVNTPSISFNCPTSTTIPACQTQTAVDEAFANWLATASASGGCNGMLSNDNSGAPPACGGSVIVTFTYTSTCAPLMTSCQATFTVAAPTSPTPVFSNCNNNTVNLGCNPFNLPSCSSIASGGFGGAVTASNSCGSVPVACNAGAIMMNGCNRTQVFTFEAMACGQTVTCTRTFTWTVVTPPTFNGTCGNSVVNLGCNPVNLPSCDPNITASNECGPITVTCNVGDITEDGCNRQQTLTYVANAVDCGTSSTCTRIYNWQVTTPPVFANCDNTVDLGCNPATLPTCTNAQTAPFGGVVTATNECGNVTGITCTAGSITSDGCNRSQVFTFMVTGCGFTSTCTRTFTWQVDPLAALECPDNTSTAAGQTQAAIDAEFSTWLAGASFTGGCAADLTNDNTGAPLACGGSTTVTFSLNTACQPTQTCQATFTVEGASGPIWYVDAAAASGGSGASWSCAFQNLQDAIDAASSGHEIWVKSGTYLPTKDPFGNASPTDPRNKTFYLKNSVAVYGGFAGTETERSERDWVANETTLSGDIGIAGDNTDNCYRVLVSVSDGSMTVLDGFTVMEGNSTGAGILTIEGLMVSYGSGMSNKSSSVALKNCYFTENVGHGITNDAATPTIIDCTFSGNSSSSYGGALYNINASSPVLLNCIISNNSASQGGGGVANWGNSNAELTNCLLSGNYGGTGGAVLNSASSPSFTNCTFSGNRCASGGAFYSQSSSAPALKNCIIWNNRLGSTTGSADASITNVSSTPVITYSLLQSLTPSGTGNLDGITHSANPNFPAFVIPLDPATAPSPGGDFHLTDCSPVLNIGTSTGAPAVDLFGYNRPYAEAVDLGVHELQSMPAAPSAMCKNANAYLGANGSATLSPAAVDNGSTGCEPLSLSVLPNSFSCSDVGTKAVVLTVVGINNFGATCAANVTVSDTLRPSALCRDIVVQLDMNGNASINASQVNNSSYDNCGIGTLSVSPNTFTIANLGINPVTLTVTDVNNNSSTCTAQVTIENNQLPNAVCQNISINLGSNGMVAIVPDDVDGGSTAIGGIASRFVSPDFLDCNNLGLNTVQLTIIGNNGQQASCNATVNLTGAAPATWYADADMDSYGDPTVSQTSCTQPMGYVANNSDCDDTNGNINPSAPEVCNGIDDDCDIDIDEGAVAPATWYADTDMDSYGDPTVSQQSCSQPTGYVSNSGDCDDTNGNINPAATEACNGVDDDCDTDIDEGVQSNWYADSDGDGYGDPAMAQGSCNQPMGYVSNDSDCDDSDPDEFPGQTWYIDSDGDNYGGSSTAACERPADGFLLAELSGNGTDDCDDTNGNINPSATEACNGVDDDCDTDIDEGAVAPATWYADTDMDSYGDPSVSQQSCTQPTGYVANSGDCDDTNGDINPAATEACNGVDDDCDTDIDEGVQSNWYADSDGDGYGDPAMAQGSCNQPMGYVSNDSDCDDSDPDEFPGQTWYIDADGDNYGSSSTAACERPADGFLLAELSGNGTDDCDDTNGNINPSATEVCNGIDDDCDTDIDEGAVAPATWYADADLDSYGDPSVSQQSCTQPTGYVANSGDCDDTNGNINPAATEACNGVDDDCDTDIDEGVQPNWYADSDNDGYGNPTVSQQSCAQPMGYVSNNSDCDDSDADEFPGQTWYIDADGDGHGVSSSLSCERPMNGFILSELSGNGTDDCDDTNGNINPAATEACNGVDDDCDTDIDEGVQPNWYADTDMDGFGDPLVSQAACNQPTGYVSDNTDCDDTDADRFPNNPEVCDGKDNDCDNDVDEGVQSTWYADSDMDGFGDPAVSQESCSQPTGYVSNDSDCDDSDADEFPGQNWYIDADGDNYGGSSTSACERPADGFLLGEISGNGTDDCNDSNSQINLAAAEICNETDDDCDTDVDEGVQSTWYADSDMDGYGDPLVSQAACNHPTGYVSDNTDCDDSDADEFPGQIWYIDADGDNYGGSTATACERPADGFLLGEISGNGTDDCTDSNSQINPAAAEVCNGTDDDCDNLVDTSDTNLVDNSPPTVFCKNYVVALNASGEAAILPADVYQSGFDNCGTVSLLDVSPYQFNCGNIGSQYVTLTVGDGNGNSNTCQALVTIQDNTDPTVVCKTTNLLLNSNGQATLDPAAVLGNGSTDNCSFTLSLDQTNFDCSHVGTNNVVLTASDPSGNMATCSTVVTVLDMVAPLALCKNANLNLDANGQAMLEAAAIDNNSYDACGITSISLDETAFSCNELGVNQVLLAVADVNGNASSCQANVTVEDKLPPTAFCKNISVPLNPNGNRNVLPAEVFENGYDNCGTVNLVSLAPNQFDCGDIGPNTAVLTVNDGHGNTGTCTATVVIEDFFTIDQIEIQPEHCGTSNGSIIITASALGGQLAYSINGGASWQLSPTFNNLVAGNYQIALKAFATTGCQISGGSVTVGVTGNLQTWYKDIDGDGFSDGLSQTSCNPPSPAWYLADDLTATNGDCNDYDPMEYPGKVWYRDMDGDNWSNGQTLIQCSRPWGYKSASELSDIWGDCNDNLATCYPGAPEICNGTDDDCDGEVDENLVDLIYVGNVVFSNQAQVNAWSQCYTVIQGNLTIQNAGVDSLPTLRQLRKVTGSVTIKLTSLDDLSWLLNLDTIGGSLTVQNNSQLQNLDGLDSLARIGGMLSHHHNLTCAECCAIYELLNTPGGIGGNKSIFINEPGCNSVGEINSECAPGSNLVGPGGDCSDCGSSVIGNISLDLVPNPATSFVNISATGLKQSGQLRVLDMAGRTMTVSQVANGERFDIETGTWEPGIYLVRLDVPGEKSIFKKLVVVR